MPLNINIPQGGAQGPFIQWFASGSMKKSVNPKSWAIREKAEGDDTAIYTITPCWDSGVVWDMDSLKLGYTGDDGAIGRAPTKVWAPTLDLVAFPAPDERKKQSGGDYWQKTVSVRMAIGGGKAATWEQAGFSAFNAFERLAPMLQSTYQEGKHPQIRQIGVETVPSKNGNSAEVPILEIVGWMDKPECLKAAPPTINTGSTEAAAPAPATPPPAAAPASQPEPAGVSGGF